MNRDLEFESEVEAEFRGDKHRFGVEILVRAAKDEDRRDGLTVLLLMILDDMLAYLRPKAIVYGGVSFSTSGLRSSAALI